MPLVCLFLMGFCVNLSGTDANCSEELGARILCLRTAAPPTIDGSLGEGCWAQAGTLSDFVVEMRGGWRHVPAAEKTSAWVTYDANNLYLAFRCEQPGAAKWAISPPSGDEVHLLVARTDLDEPLHLVVERSGKMNVAFDSGAVPLDCQRARAATATGEGVWTAELAIPFGGEPPKKGDVWRLNLGRTSERGEVSSLECTYGGLDDVTSFAEMQFEEHGVVVRELDLGDERADWGGIPEAGASVRNCATAPVEVSLQTVVTPGGKAFGPREMTLAPGEEKVLRCEYEVEEASGNRIALLVGVKGSRPCWVFSDRPLQERFLLPRLAKQQGFLEQCSTYLAQAIANLGEFGVLAQQVKRMEDEVGPLRQRVAAGEGERSQCEVAIEQLAESAARMGVLLGILRSYSLSEVTAGTMGRKFAVFSLPASETATYLTMPPPERALRMIEARACAGEYKAINLQIASAESLRNVSVDATDLVGEEGRISRQDVSLWVVRCWYQDGDGAAGEAEKILVPELLLKDDRQPLVGPKPALRLEGEVTTDIPAGVSKQISLTIRVPENAAAGVYRGRLTVTPLGRRSLELPLELQVLPFRLEAATPEFAVYSLGRLGGAHRLTLAEYQRQLRDIREHGFEQASIADGAEFVPQALALRAVEGLMQEAVWMAGDPSADWQPALVKRTISPRLACKVELGGGLDRSAATVRDRGQATFARVDGPLSAAQAATVDVGCFPADAASFARHLARRQQGVTEPSPASEYCCWDASREDPLTDRFLCGIYLWRWNLDGAMPFVYQQIAGPDPYGEGSGGKRQHMLTYPSLRGPVSTVQWEACREGIYDLRYVATLQSWLDRAKWEVNRLIETGEGTDSPRVQALMKAYAEEAAILEGIQEKVGLHPGQTLRSWSASSFDGLRDGITDAVVKLQQLVEGGQQPSLTP